MNDNYFMKEAIKEAELAAKKGNYGIGAIIVLNKNIISRSGNEMISRGIKTYAHAEFLAIEKLRDTKYDILETYKQMTIYTTLQSCPMCWGRILNSGIKEVVYGADDPESVINIKYAIPPIFKTVAPKVRAIGGELEKECRDIFIKSANKLDKLFVNTIRKKQ